MARETIELTSQNQSAMQAVKRVTMAFLVLAVASHSLAESKKLVDLASAVNQAAQFANQKDYTTIQSSLSVRSFQD